MALTRDEKDALRARITRMLLEPEAEERADAYSYLRASDPIKGYSVRNTLMLLLQAQERGIDLQMCAGFREWRTLGRKVKKGEAGLFITAYSPKGRGTDAEEQRAFFGGTYVFDISQTEPIENED